jgi:hypothetical protein
MSSTENIDFTSVKTDTSLAPYNSRYATIHYCGPKLCPHCNGVLVPATKLPQYVTYTFRLEEEQNRRWNEAHRSDSE